MLDFLRAENEISFEIHKAAIRFLNQLPAWAGEPEVSVDLDGEVGFDWFPGMDTITVSVGVEGRLSWAFRIGQVKAHGGGQL